MTSHTKRLSTWPLQEDHLPEKHRGIFDFHTPVTPSVLQQCCHKTITVDLAWVRNWTVKLDQTISSSNTQKHIF